MRLQKIMLVILVIVLFGCSKENKEITIKGRINGFNNEKVEYTTPIDGKWFYGNKKSIAPDSLGGFQIKMNIDEPSFVTIYVLGKSGGVLVVEPGKTYDVDFNIGENKNKNKFIVNSENSLAQNLYNSYPTPEFYISAVQYFLTDSIPSEISKKINNQQENTLSKFDELLEKGKISKGFHELALSDRKSYYLAMEATVAKMLLYKYENNKLKLTAATNFWSQKLDPSLVNESTYIRSPWFYALVENLIRFRQMSIENFDPKQLKALYENGNIYQYNIDEAKTVLSGKELEYYLATYIYYESWQTKDNSKKIIQEYEKFKNDYPNSLYNEYLETSLKPIVDFHNKLEKTHGNEEIKFVENSKNIDTFNQLVEELQGKKVFVDIWGTWCGPCKKEFEHKKPLYTMLESKNITVLYICEGEHSKEKVWKEMIDFYDLEGHHVFTNEKLLADIIDKFGNNGQFAYPRYLLIDENGIVVNEQASYPSNLKQLEREINENYVWQ